MTLPLDHLVILVQDLQAATADYRALGFNVQPGGTHADGATHNALVVFADGSYIELIAFLRSAPEHRWGGAAARGHRGFIDYALLPGSVAAVVAEARQRGLTYEGPFDGGRLRPDGQRLQWQTGTPPHAGLPFLCGDITPRALRVREGDVRVHANGVLGVASVCVAVADLSRSLAEHEALLGLRGQTLHLTGTGLQQAMLPLGPHTTLALVAPAPDAPVAVAEALRAALGGRAAGVIGASLRGPAGTALPAAGCHGAALDIVAG